MRLGLIGPGKHGRRYLLPENGGEHIVAVGTREAPLDLDQVNGVIIATPPDTHCALVLQALEAGKAVLCEKPLALTREECMAMLDAADRVGGRLAVAHQHVWALDWRAQPVGPCVAKITYREHTRDYSPWLDWAPHGLALLASAMPEASALRLRHSLLVHAGGEKRVHVHGADWSYDVRDGDEPPFISPMWLMVSNFAQVAQENAPQYWRESNAFNRRVYEALFL